MTKPGTCPNCGASADGRFCGSCGTALAGASCAQCGNSLVTGALFCHRCGSATAVSRGARTPGAKALAWVIPGVAVLALVAFLIGQRVSIGSASVGAGDVSRVDAGVSTRLAGTPPGGAVRAPDISRMTPEDRAKALFDRVMRYGQEGKQDSIRFFAPMAMQAYQMLGALDAHDRYDVGIIAIVSGDAAVAGAQSDTILNANPTHLLGLVLGIKAAGLRNDPAGQRALEKRLVAAAATERARNLKEYTEHRRDIEAAINQVGAGKPQ
jgi:double zinc ribbon protein